ncbi:group III truncated hemoglobin [Nonlabens antarcticus]|uniref:group III truncated hemoglobin n=1 Tax=Nonlabens antarcticus TaxID=392714 RepID=UPI0018911E89|nr:group III truncated hemoglobin [Nonlabens antarcticus]
MKADILFRKDIKLLVETFYERVRLDPTLGPVFNRHIKDWESHLELLTDFWETSLFRTSSYKGNPITAHNAVDKIEQYTIDETHFGIWLNHWVQTLDYLFVGDNATTLKLRARKMGTNLNLNLFNQKPKT